MGDSHYEEANDFNGLGNNAEQCRRMPELLFTGVGVQATLLAGRRYGPVCVCHDAVRRILCIERSRTNANESCDGPTGAGQHLCAPKYSMMDSNDKEI
jgi:hypothetical protein